MTDVETVENLAGCLLITGTPGAGKTTVTQMVAERLPRAARLDADVFGMMLVSGWANMLDHEGNWNPGPEGKRQLRLRMVNVCSTADNFAEAGITPVVDQVVETREELAFIAGRLRARPLMLVVLCPPLEVARHRNETRQIGGVGYDFAPLAQNQRRELGDLGWWLDSGELTAEETADLIVAEAAKRAVITEAQLRA
ncbi:AAA family ATPase [Glycomyces buryatensis]|uniref:Phosphotransferase n=1 Tax=Glycomyces buryatensis TaxID=2570927 RepID=A0A4S8Q6J5_9ACTN|nr:AAA family ATPase [Glycomyces buryatensis]THV39750.1 phosphotransferase [Glycomyces buryatensis]